MRFPTATSLLILAAFVLIVQPAPASAVVVFELDMDGLQEIPGPGDDDGVATGTISFDDTAGVISWNFTYENITAPTAMHIHGPAAPAGTAAGVFIGLGVATSGGAGTLVDSITDLTLVPEINQILASPSEFYVNIHNADFGPGAVRGQLGVRIPEPSTLALLMLGALGLVRFRRLRV